MFLISRKSIVIRTRKRFAIYCRSQMRFMPPTRRGRSSCRTARDRSNNGQIAEVLEVEVDTEAADGAKDIEVEGGAGEADVVADEDDDCIPLRTPPRRPGPLRADHDVY